MAETKIFGISVNTDMITNLPDIYKIIAGGVVAGLILFGAGFYLVYPVYQEYQVLVQENEKLKSENDTLETKLGYNPTTKRYKRIDDVEEQMKNLDIEIKEMQTRIPETDNIPTLIYDLERIVEEDNKTDLFDIVPAAARAVSLPPELVSKTAGLNLQQVPLSLTMESSFPKMIGLFKDFERYQRAINTSSLSLAPIMDPTNKFITLRVSLNLKAFVLPEATTAAAVQPKKK